MISETAAATVAETAAIPETAVAEAATIAEAAAVKEASVAEATVAEGSIEEASTVAEASNAGEVDELSVGRTSRADNVSRLRGPRLDIQITWIEIQRRFGDIGQRRAGECHDTSRGNGPYSKGTQQGTACQLVHVSSISFATLPGEGRRIVAVNL
jgi:hypothetical protein